MGEWGGRSRCLGRLGVRACSFRPPARVLGAGCPGWRRVRRWRWRPRCCRPPLAAQAPAHAAPRPAAPAKPACPAQRPDETSAAIAAKLCGSRVEVTSRLSETTQVWANPDGTLTAERHLAPVRVRQGDRWVPVDLTLQRQPDGSVAPKAHPVGLRLSGAVADAGEHELVTLGAGDRQIGLGWKGRLPDPALVGSTATYRDVLPDVDLVVTVHRTGYEQSFVVRSRAGLAHVARLVLPVRSGKLAAVSDGAGALVFKDKAGTEVGRTHPAQMWDAAVAPGSLEHVRRAPVAVKAAAAGAGRTSLALNPDFDAFVQTDYASDQSGSVDLKLGYSDDGGARTARSYLKFDTTGVWDQTITDA